MNGHNYNTQIHETTVSSIKVYCHKLPITLLLLSFNHKLKRQPNKYDLALKEVTMRALGQWMQYLTVD